ncbi:ABC transporter substrate-binding protein [Paenibacillus baekrokdamisoli]|uniref:ABC transporter substrate-binding protein n=1 Tax=Paenibacillus baekrokdamisoli TaxID=1712516 RepID=A0A3G9IQI6_9BACL|nr:metal ABC transporter substrate-binding protein [Paenibacillus baekrokdamisoli]MBB3070125.1 zinc transport system substrate-binding protein [Paenibacillus baekrokdamisoli]BBH21137.1 ABC transporter substrate-binding protein [Paenibacillus baekrokdamisoli]
MNLRRKNNFSFFAIAIILSFVMLTLAGCGTSSSKLVEGKTNIVTSFYPLYFLAKEIGGEQTNVINMIPAGVEPHDWSPKSRDLDTVSKAQLFLYNGAGLEGWVDNFLHGLSKDNPLVTLKASAGIPLISGHADNEGSQANKEDTSVDPHTWVSPKSMIIMSKNVLDSLIKVDPAHRKEYEANEAKLREKLSALDDKYRTKLSTVSNKNIVTSHQAFGYLARDYGLHQVAIMGLSPDAEPKAQDLLRIAKFVKDNNVKYIFFEELVTDELAKTLAREVNAQTMVLNPLEGLTPEQEKKGEDYFSLMEANLQNLLQALQ